MDLLEAVAEHAANSPDVIVHAHRGQHLTFSQLAERSDAVAAHLTRLGLRRGEPVVVYGHKQGAMLICFLAAVKAGHPYIPVDSSLPPSRVQAIVDSAKAPLLVAVEPIEIENSNTVTWDQLAQLPPASIPASLAVGQDDPYYIIYTSGSTGAPKGVQISRSSVANFVAWALKLAGAGTHVILNQAPFSFDLSVYELAMAQASGSRMHSIDKQHLGSYRDLIAELRESGITVWVSTPSFADLCLAVPEFDAKLLPELRTFLFCGETLSHETASQLRQRFPDSNVYNTYGPTESTVAVTAVLCDDQLLAAHRVLPVGAPKPGTEIWIVDEAGRALPPGETGEIVIVGDTVSLGYYRQDDLNAVSFAMVETPAGRVRSYHTGDAGFIKDGQLHFLGRLDFQIKLHGYRIEIEDVEANLRKLPDVRHAVVVPMGSGAITHLHAVLALGSGIPQSSLKQTIALKRELKALVPDYMVPKTFAYVDAMPLTANGKVDRGALKAQK